MTEFRYKAFLCYSHADKAWADWLHRELERYRIPRHLVSASRGAIPRNLRPIFRDREELPSASNLPQLIQDALAQSESLIVVCSPAAVRSQWVNNEIRTFRELGREARIFCLIVDGEPNAGNDRECFPAALRGEHGWDVMEPIAADVRPHGDGKGLAKQKIIAGLLGVGLDELVQREVHRRHRRLIALSTGSSLIALLMAGLAVFAFLSQQEAERRREDAEELVGFMIGDLRQKLNEVGRLDIFDSVADQATNYFASLGSQDARDEVLAMRAETLRQIGRVRMDQGNAGEAEQAFREAREISTLLVERDPLRPEWQINLANEHFWLGFLAWQRGNLDAASTAFQSQLALVDKVSASDPQNANWLSEKLYAWTNYGRVLEARGQLEEAQSAYTQVMESAEQLTELEPDNIEWELELGFAHNNFGKLSVSLGDLAEAEEHYAIDLEIKRLAHESRPSHNLWREYLGVSQYYWGEIRRLQGRYDAALESLYAAQEVFEQLLLYDEEGTMPWHHRLAVIERTMAMVHQAGGRPHRANEAITRSLERILKLTQADPKNLVWRRDQGMSHLEAARVARALGERERAASHAATAREIASSWLSGNSDDPEALQLEAASLLVLGDLDSDAGDSAAARTKWQAGLASVNRITPGSSDPAILDLAATFFERLERPVDAAPLLARLERMGYRRR